jgi:hypothetical protein
MGIMTLSVLEAPQPASAGWTKKKVCDTPFINSGKPRQQVNRCRADGWKNCTSETVGAGYPLYGLRNCYEVDVLVPDDWKGASASGVNKTFAPSTNSKQK